MSRRIAPKSCPCFAGNYRGSNVCKELASYNVEVRTRAGLKSAGVGVPYSEVATQIADLESESSALIADFSAWRQQLPTGRELNKVIVSKLVVLLAKTLERFFTIHPYANGNGHAGRLLIWVMMTSNGFAPTKWPLDDSPGYDDALQAHREGSPLHLQTFIVDAMLGIP